MSRAGMRVLIAGCGDVGTRLGLVLARAGHVAFGLRRRPQGLPAAIDPVAADLSRPQSLGALPGLLDAVVYAAAADARSEAAYRAAYVAGVANLLAALAARGPLPARLLFASSTSVYGQDDGSVVDEGSPTVPAGFTGRLVLEGEGLVRAAGGSVLRLAGIYGPGRLRLVERIRSGAQRVQREPPRFTNRIHADDAAAALAHLLELARPAPVYVGVDDEPAPEAEVADWLAARLGVPAPPAAPAGAGGRGKRCSNARLRASGFAPRHPSYREGYAALLPQLAAAPGR